LCFEPDPKGSGHSLGGFGLGTHGVKSTRGLRGSA
jgi:hypothetical protein